MKSFVYKFCLILILLCFEHKLLCQWITHHDPIFQINISKPALKDTITDPAFGTNIIRITDAKQWGYPGFFPQYSKRQAWNCNETNLILQSGDGRTFLFNGENYQFLKELQSIGGEDIFWHPFDSNKIIFTSENSLCVFDINTDQAETLHTFSDYSFINTRGEGNLSNDGRYYAFVGQIYDSLTHFKDIVVYDLIKDSIIAKLELPQNLDNFDWVSISPLGNYVVIDYATTDTGRFQGVEVYTKQLQYLWQKPLGYGHSDLTIDENNNEVLIMDYYDEANNITRIKKIRLEDGVETNLLDFSWQFDSHISARNKYRKGWCFISTFDGPGRLEDDSLSWLPFEDEIFALKMDGSGMVQRIAHHHSKRYSPITPDPDNSIYWAEPHASVSPEGSRIIFGSNWRLDVQSDSSIDAYIVDFRNFLSADISNANDFDFYLFQNYPNPFNSNTVIKFSIPKKSDVSLKIFDLLGREIKTLISMNVDKGTYEIIVPSNLLSSGIYFYQLKAGNYIHTKKMIHIK
jgi:hypothetical protein